jgi:hypothetical protein
MRSVRARKRGILTRDAVVRILDYASDLVAQEPEDFALMVQENSGRAGIESISDFANWYKCEFPAVDDPLRADLRMVLVGLGVDDRARRMVNFLAESGGDIQLLTFQAFRDEMGTILARHVETVDPKGGRADTGWRRKGRDSSYTGSAGAGTVSRG